MLRRQEASFLTLKVAGAGRVFLTAWARAMGREARVAGERPASSGSST